MGGYVNHTYVNLSVETFAELLDFIVTNIEGFTANDKAMLLENFARLGKNQSVTKTFTVKDKKQNVAMNIMLEKMIVNPDPDEKDEELHGKLESTPTLNKKIDKEYLRLLARDEQRRYAGMNDSVDLTDTIEAINDITASLQLAPTQLVTIYLLSTATTPVATTSLSSLGERAPAMNSADVPAYEDEPMDHILTIDLRDVPQLKLNLPNGTRAISLFVSSRFDNEAYEPGTDQAAVVLRSDNTLAQHKPAQDSGPACVFTPVQVPRAMFSEDEGDAEPLEELRDLLDTAPGYVGGGPIWLQAPEHDGPYIGQFNEGLLDVNLGDAGTMYIFTDTAFWQCH